MCISLFNMGSENPHPPSAEKSFPAISRQMGFTRKSSVLLKAKKLSRSGGLNIQGSRRGISIGLSLGPLMLFPPSNVLGEFTSPGVWQKSLYLVFRHFFLEMLILGPKGIYRVLSPIRNFPNSVLSPLRPLPS